MIPRSLYASSEVLALSWIDWIIGFDKVLDCPVELPRHLLFEELIAVCQRYRALSRRSEWRSKLPLDGLGQIVLDNLVNDANKNVLGQ